MKIAIVFHSVCGNSYLVGRAFQDGLSATGCQVEMYRVADQDWVEKPDVPPQAKTILAAMSKVPEAQPQDLVDVDMIILGSPTYFGNVTAEMKAFMDATGGLWVQGKLVGKKFFAYTSVGNSEGGGGLCLQAMHTYAKYMGMLSISLPLTVLPGENITALGVVQYPNGKYAESLDAKTERLVRNCCIYLSEIR